MFFFPDFPAGLYSAPANIPGGACGDAVNTLTAIVGSLR